VVVAGPQDVDDPRVLEVPQQRAAVDGAVDAPLELGVGKRLERAGQRQMHAGEILVAPERPGDPVQRPQDFPCLPLVVGQEALEVTGRLVQIQDQGEEDVVGHGGLAGVPGLRSRG
jgi:hypothetical protein